jgi:hypothetical protein
MTSQNTKGRHTYLTIYYMNDYEVRGLFGKYLAILNISRTGHVALI